MSEFNKDEFKKFLEMSEEERFEYLTDTKLYFYRKLYIKFLNKWWTFMRKANPHLRAIDLWESIYKGRF